jgi:hypothetical protein
MPVQPIVRHTPTCPPFESVVRILSSEPYSQILDEYRSVLEDDPEYLRYYCAKTALRLQLLLKLKELPSLTVGGCLEGSCDACCIIGALKEAMSRHLSHDACA